MKKIKRERLYLTILALLIVVLLAVAMPVLGLVRNGTGQITELYKSPPKEQSIEVGSEITELRTRTNKTHWLGNNSYSLDGTIGSIHYWENEQWQEIDNLFEPAISPWDWQMLEAGYHIRVKEDFTSGQIIEFEKQGEVVQFQPMALEWTNDLDQIQQVSMPQDVTPVITNPEVDLLPAVGILSHQGTIRWNDAYGEGLDFEWRCSSTRLIKILEIESLSRLPIPEQYILDGDNPVLRLNLIFDPSVDIYVDGNEWDESSKVQTFSIVEFRKDSEVLWSFMPLRYWDSEGNGEQSIATLEKRGNKLYISIRVSYGWLQNAVYPVFIDVDVDEYIADGMDDASTVMGSIDNEGVYAVLTNPIMVCNAYFRFLNITVPKGTTIDAAYVDLRAGTMGDGGSDTLIQGIDEDNTTNFDTTAAELDGRDLTTAEVLWDLGSWTDGTWYGRTNDPQDIKAIIEEICARSGWSSGNALAIRYTGEIGGMQSCRCYDGGDPANNAARIHIEYTVDDWVQVEYSADDAYETNTRYTYTTDNSIELLSADRWGGLRWRGINIPDGANIGDAWVKVYCNDNNDSWRNGVTAWLQNTSNPPAFTSAGNPNSNISGRTKTDASTVYPGGQAGVGWYTAPSITAMLQEVVDDNEGTGDALVYFYQHNSTLDWEIRTEDFSDGSLAAKLYIEYTTGTPPTVVTLAATSITTTSAHLNGNVTSIGSENVTRGFEWDTDSGAPYSNSWDDDGTWGVGTYYYDLAGLDNCTTIYYRAKANNTAGTSYGSESSFTTLTPTLPQTPTVAATNGGFNSYGASHSILLPAGAEAGDLLLAFVALTGDPTSISFPGWNLIFKEQTGVSEGVTFGAWYRAATGCEAASDIMTIAGGSERSAYHTFRITGFQGAPEVGSATTGLSSSPDPPSLSPTWELGNTLWFAAVGYESDETISVYPTSYCYGNNTIGEIYVGVGTARRELNATSDNPSTFTLSGSDDWVANTVAIRPPPVAPTSYDFLNVEVSQTYETGITEFTVSNTHTTDLANVTISTSDILVHTAAPSVVQEVNRPHVVRTPTQTNSFYAAGRHWVYWIGAGPTGYYSTSCDAINWEWNVESLGDAEGPYSDWTFDGTYVHLVRGKWVDGFDIYYRRGIPQTNGTISWSAAWQTAVAIGSNWYAEDPNITIDSNGYPIIAYGVGPAPGINYVPYAAKNSKTDGTWTTEWTKQISSNLNVTQDIVALENGQLYTTWHTFDSANTKLQGRLYEREVAGTDNSGVDNKTGNMTDTTKNFITEGVANGAYLYNVTDGRSFGVVTGLANTTNPYDTILFSGGLSGGTENDFDDGDTYEVFDWQTAEDASSSNISGAFSSWCSRAVGNNVDVVFLSSDGNNPTEQGNITHRHRTFGSGWGSETVLETGVYQGGAPMLTRHGDNGDLAAFWSRGTGIDAGDNHIYYKRYRDGSWDTNATDWIDEEVLLLDDLNAGDNHPHYNAFEETFTNRMTITYQTGNETPWRVKYAMLSFQRWYLSDTAEQGVELYGLKVGLDDDDDNYDITVTAEGVTLITNLGNNTSQDFGLKFYAPTWFESKLEMAGTVAVTLTYDDETTTTVYITLSFEGIAAEIYCNIIITPGGMIL